MAVALVLGASGFLGGHVHARLVRRLGLGHVVGTSGPRPLGAGGLVALSLADASATTALVAGLRPSLVVWTAMARADAAPDEDAALTRSGLGAAIDALAAGARLVYLSSDSVLAGDMGPYDESAAAHAAPLGTPLAGYINAKIAGEGMALALGSRALVVRCGPIYGRSTAGTRDGRSAALLRAWREGRTPARPVNLLRSWVHVEDLADTLLAAVDAGLCGILHAGPALGMSHFAFARALAHAAGVDPSRLAESRLTEDEARLRHVRLDLRLDTTRARTLLGAEARPPERALAAEF